MGGYSAYKPTLFHVSTFLSNIYPKIYIKEKKKTSKQKNIQVVVTLVYPDSHPPVFQRHQNVRTSETSPGGPANQGAAEEIHRGISPPSRCDPCSPGHHPARRWLRQPTHHMDYRPPRATCGGVREGVHR